MSRRQLQILHLVAQGATGHEVAWRLAITENTARSHIRQILRRLEARSCAHAVYLAMQRGFLAVLSSDLSRD